MSSSNIRDYSSQYGIKDFILNDIAPKYFDIEDVSLLNVGLFGMVTDIGATVAQDAFITTSRYISELLPGQSTLPEFVYAQAANYGINNIFSTCASCDALLFIREDHILEYGQKDGNYTNYYIDSDLKVYIDDIIFSIPYDIRIRTRYYNGTYNHNCTYYTGNINNSMVDNTHPYIKCYKTKIKDNDDSSTYLALSVKLYQYKRRRQTESIITNSVINIPYFDFTYENQLANIEIVYKNPDGTSKNQLIKLLSNEPATNVPFCYYKMVDDHTFRILFNTNDMYFVPEFNSEIEVYIYETLGGKGNFPQYKGDNMYVSGDSSNTEWSYNKTLPIFSVMTGASGGGRDTFTLEQLALQTWESSLSLKSITTDKDLDRYFASYTALYDTKALFIKTRDDFASREYACYTRIRDESNVFPTNTLDLIVKFDNIGGYIEGQNRYIIDPGKRIIYNGNSETEAIIISEEDDAPADGIEYTTIGLMSLELNPNNLVYYMNSIDKTVKANYSYINDESIFQFILKSFNISRNAIEGEKRYHIKLVVLPTDYMTLGNTMYVDDYSGDTDGVPEYDADGNPIIEELDDGSLSVTKLKVYLYANTADKHYIELTYNAEESSSYSGFTFDCYLDTNDIINSETIEITNMYSTESNMIETCSLSISNPDLSVLIFYKDDEPIGHVYHSSIPATSEYTLCNTFTPDADSYYLAYPLSLMRSSISFLPSGDDAGFYIKVSGVPLFSRHFLLDNNGNDVKDVLDQINGQHSFLQQSLLNIISNFSIHFKFFNTYGRSKTFSIGEDQYLNRTYCDIKLGIKLFDGVDDGCFTDIRNTVKTYIEGLNSAEESSINSISVSQLLSIIHNTYSDKVDAIVFYSINGYDSSVQLITMNTDLSSSQNMNTIPEFLTINTNDIILTRL